MNLVNEMNDNMKNNNEENEIEDIVRVVRFKKSADDDWSPGMKIIEPHQFDHIWVAGMMFNILAIYVNLLEDSEQNEFIKKTTDSLDVILGCGFSHITVVDEIN